MGQRNQQRRSGQFPFRVVRRIRRWFVFTGNRLTLTALVSLVVFVALLALTESGYLAVGPDSNAGSFFSGGLVAGVLTVVTIVLTINQLILSRVFGSIDELGDRLDGATAFRAEVEDLADVPVTPNDPAAFLALLGQTLDRRAEALRSDLSRADTAVDQGVLDALEGAAEYGSHLEDSLERESSIPAVLDVLLATEYARKVSAMREIRHRHEDSLDEAHLEGFQAIEDVFDAIALTRQFFKTLALQENLARLSRIVATTGLASFFATIVLALIYRSGSVTVDPGQLPLVVSAGLTVIAVPVLAVIVYTLRVATVARQTVSVGTFVQPDE